MLAFVGVISSVLLFLTALSGGAALAHMRAALALAFDVRLLAESAVARWPFVVGLSFAALAAAWAGRGTPEGRTALVTLATSYIVSTLGLGKLGATMNYMMEPALASVVVLSVLPFSLPRAPGLRVAIAAAVGLSVSWAGVATARSLLHERRTLHDEERALEEVARRCVDRPSAIVMSNDPGIELTVNGRLYTHTLELWNEARLGRFPERLWLDDVSSPNVRCLVGFSGDAPPPVVPEGFPPKVLRALEERFVLDSVHYGYAVYGRRDSPLPRAPK
jgi:hypothetical protein